ncbi:MAG: phage tail protein [Sphaerochaeta sp.]|nr:phage tail protein [Sphaerochaeta sp.]MDD3916248.1 phage tail protein [Synergistaceae bacterium]
MAVISILSEQSDFTGEMPVTSHTKGLWRFNSGSVSDENVVSFPDASDYMRPAVLVGSDYALSTDAVFGNSLELNITDSASYLRVQNDGTMFSPLYGRFAFGGCFKVPIVPTTVVPLLAAQSAGQTSLFRLEVVDGHVTVMLCGATGATCYICQETMQLQANRWYFIGVTVDTEGKTVQTVVGDYADGSFYTSPVRTFQTAVNPSSAADLLIGAWDYEHEGNLTCASAVFDDVFIETDSDYTAYLLERQFLTSRSADQGNATCDVWTSPGTVTLQQMNGVYPPVGDFITRAVAYDITGSGKAAWDFAYLSGSTSLGGVESSTSSDLLHWTEWSPVDMEGNITSPVAEYIRFRITLCTNDTTRTPRFNELRVYDIPNKLFEVRGYSYPVILDSSGAPAAVLENVCDITVAGEINGEDVLKFSLPFKDAKRPFIQNEAKIQIVDDIYKIRTVTDEKSSDGTSTTTVYAEAEFYDLGFSVYRPVKEFISETAKTEMAYALDGTGWYVGDVQVSTKRSWKSEKTNALAILRAIADIHGGDLVFDCPRRLVHLYTQYGSDSGAVFAYNKNMSQIRKVTNTGGLITRLYAIGAEGMTFADMNNGRPYVEDYTYTSEVRISTLDCTSFTNPTQMLEYTRMRLAQYATPTVSYELSAMDLSLLTGYRHEKWELGDRVTVYDRELDINVKTRVVRREYNLQEPWKSKLELSTTLKNLSSSSSTWDSAVAATEGESLVSSVDIKDMVPFNHLKNSRADDGFAHWLNNGFVVDTESGASGSNSFKASGVLNGTKSLSQIVYPATRDNYTFSAKVAADNIELGADGAVTLEIEVTYDDGSVESKEYDLY